MEDAGAKKVVSSFLEKQPLYSKVEIDKYYWHPDFFYGLTFQFYCETDSSIQTFTLGIEPEGSSTDRLDPYQPDHFIKFTQHFSGQCQYCKKFKVDFLLNVFSDGPMPDFSRTRFQGLPTGGTALQTKIQAGKTQHKLFVRKIGQYPPYEIAPDKEVLNFFRDDDKEFYKKALICLSQSFGVGAYAYLRRITENEILRIVESLAEIQTPEGERIKKILGTYRSNNQMSNLIEGVYKHLPSSLTSLGTNPLKVLYAHYSEGIHTYSEEVCLQKAFSLDTVLKFTIKKLNEEKHELTEIRKALKDLGN